MRTRCEEVGALIAYTNPWPSALILRIYQTNIYIPICLLRMFSTISALDKEECLRVDLAWLDYLYQSFQFNYQ